MTSRSRGRHIDRMNDLAGEAMLYAAPLNNVLKDDANVTYDDIEDVMSDVKEVLMELQTSEFPSTNDANSDNLLALEIVLTTLIRLMKKRRLMHFPKRAAGDNMTQLMRLVSDVLGAEKNENTQRAPLLDKRLDESLLTVRRGT